MARKIAIKSVFIFYLSLVLLAENGSAQNNIALNDTCFVIFKNTNQYSTNKFIMGYSKNIINFNYLYVNSLKSPLFIFDSSKNQKQQIGKDYFDSITFSDPWDTYIYYHKATKKPVLYLITIENNKYYQYPVVIEFPPPPPKPLPIE